MKKIGNSDFSTKQKNYYDLDIIISVGYCVNQNEELNFPNWQIVFLRTTSWRDMLSANVSNASKVVSQRRRRKQFLRQNFSATRPRNT